MKQKMIDVSIHLFDKKGFTETSIQEIVDELGVTKGTFYYYFTNKQELLTTIHLNFIEFLLKKQDEILQDEAKDSREKLRAMIYMVLQSINERKKSARIFFREMRNLGPKYLEQNVEKRDQFRKNLQQLVEEGIRKGEFQEDLHADMVTRGILGMTNWSYYWYNPEGDVSAEELTDIYVEILLNGINKSD
ncbi:TetR family transcriptional regulator [Halobacillus halophilus]|uniref:TetR family transcription regulator n=1 Tax=Halobacillus halophilus (strain ATCC 35676 / DSM 2266 / JCM 20832 / KCTC 3685 / LMG 17431 / NBRC 102448 / NCIMB 2269) TaxID=866895 RepID=I0JID3_HALH3|nr:TetR/AcrR family transcriptional regulator [Halobacillus halophilus]ASF38086.1 TetR family transcriptional regulator [Halobacillus halophilus]CCG43901.1 TetR family transcription regulator [Halobacillus halophilus DSM 2266]